MKMLRNFGATNIWAPLCLRSESTMNNQPQLNYHGGQCQCCCCCRRQEHLGVELLKFWLHSPQLMSTCGLHDWKRQMDVNDQRRKTIPKLVYLHNPWKFVLTKFNLWKLRWFWDHDFKETDFIEGSKQAAVVMTDIIRKQLAEKISEFTTPVGFQQITRDMLLSRNDMRLKLVRFEKEHLRRAIPMKVATRQNFGRKYAFIDMLFVGLRNTKDFDSAAEAVEINELIRRMDDELKTPPSVVSVPHRIVFAEIFIRFRRDYTDDPFRTAPPPPPSPASDTSTSPDGEAQQKKLPIALQNDSNNWAVSFYKILTFDVLNYDPNPNRAPLK